MRKTLGERLAYEGYAIEATDDVSEASEMCRQMAFDVVLTDDSSNASPLGIPFIVLAGAGDNQIQRAVTAFRDGAMDFLQIPSDINRLYDTLRRYSEEEAPTQTPLPKQRMSAHAMGRARRTRASSVQPIIGSSNAIGNVRQVVERIAAFDTRTLITGENGTGKELVARWLHAKSRRASGPFVEVNCAAIPSELIESELFGHERGAFTSAIKQRKGKFEQATGGTLFMDEIGDMSLAAQAKVLRALQENKICRVGSDKDIDVDVRVIAATNKNLREEIAKGNFREDLYHRLSVIVIRVPPLRERSSDVPELTQHFVDEISSLYGIPPKPIDSDAMEALSAMRQTTLLALTTILRPVEKLKPTLLCPMGGMGAGSYGGRTHDMCADFARWQQDGWRILVLSGGAARGERMRQSFEDEGVKAAFDELGTAAPKSGECRIYPLTLSGGFQYPQIKVAVIASGDVYGAKSAKGKPKKQQGSKIASFTDLNVGDYVVHETHGIGIYQGTKRLTSEGASRDYLLVQYLGSDKLYIPVDHLDRIQKYIGGGEGAAPKLSRLDGKDWDKQKSKVRESLKELAFDLVKLYAERQKNRGYAFGPDTPWQQEFEENFPYDETPDQLQATEEIKRDMERDLPMDRLLCGDVGYGKTEVALRAAFKAVMDGKQVAILAPTTILAQQHYNTLMRRMEGFPVHADVLSRFRSAKEQKESLRRLKDGEIDIIVGTHRLLAKDVQFKNLGLLIVDEEQRFGVGHKESIKNMKKTVDVLTMSATPIPRTLHMSMVGIRDMSLLETPPQARYPVQTYVMEYQDSVIRDAILREIGRGGQVFFLYNRVGSIDQCYKQLSKLVPEARIAIAHGQMREHALEDVMLDFSQQKFDVLLCTTIIESGLDIPMANTLIIYDADHFGLGQLYQMRGRVGRSNRLAYAYFTVRPGKVLSETAQKRLDAIREFTEFGSGFRIAMRDLELRGAGNLLGPQQSGHLANIGYDLYCKLLEEAVLEAQGEAPKPNRDVETRMDVHVNAYLPAEYVTGDRQRLEVYKRIASITTAAQRDDVEEELVDRFGDEPLCVANLVAVAYLKAMCEKLGIDRVNQADGRIDMRFALNAQVDGQKLFTALNGFDKRLTLNAAPPVTLTLRDQTLNREDLLMLCVKVMERLLARMELSAA